MLVANGFCQVLSVPFEQHQPFAQAAMTTVLARPLGGYGLTPLVFEPQSPLMQSSSSNSVTKVRKSPVYEVLLPNYDEEQQHLLNHQAHLNNQQLPLIQDVNVGPKLLKKLDYESIVSNKIPAPAAVAPIVQSHTNIHNQQQATSEYFNSMLDLLKSSASSYSSVPSYKENSFGNTKSFAPVHSGFQSSFPSNGQQYTQGPVTAAIQSIRSVELNDLQDTYDSSEPQVIDIPPSAMPIVINFRTSASQLQIHQSHEPSEPKEIQETQSQDEPHFLRHSVTKPVIQEVHEIIMPYRRIIQEIRPVEEEIKTIVARGVQGKAGLAGAGQGGLIGGPALMGDQIMSIGNGAIGGIGLKQHQGGAAVSAGKNLGTPNALTYAVNKLTSGAKYKS